MLTWLDDNEQRKIGLLSQRKLELMFAVCAEFISNPMRILCICVFMCALKCGAVLISFLIQITPALSPPHHTSSGHLGDYNCSRFGRHPRGASGAPQNCSHSFSTLCFFPPFFWHVFGCFTLWTEVIFVISISWSTLAPKLRLFAFLLNANFKFQICFCICRLSETDHANDQRQIGLRLPLYCFTCADRYIENHVYQLA